jgi:hypothetical protein
LHAVTEKGKQRLLEELRENMLAPSTGDNIFALAMCFNSGMSADEAIEILEKRIGALNKQIERFKMDYEEAKKYKSYHWMILANAGVKGSELEIEMAREFIGLFKEVPNYFTQNLPEMYRYVIQNISQ